MYSLPARDLDHILEHTESLWADARRSRIFITGGTGFVGTWLAESLLWANCRLSLGIETVLLTRDGARVRWDGAGVVIGDAAEFEMPAGTFEFTVHAATNAHVAPNVDSPTGMLDRDVAGTRRVLEFAKLHGTRRLLFTSSGAVYGKQPPDLSNVPEDYMGAPDPCDTASAYGFGKRISEHLWACYSQVYRFEATIARLFAFIGPHLPLDVHYAAGNFLRDALAGGPIQIAGDGTPYRSYLYAADLAIWLWTILFRGHSARPYNVGSPEPVSVLDLARAIGPGLEIHVAKKAAPGAPAARYVPSTERAEKELGLRVWVPLDEAIRRTTEWHRRRGPAS
jgi:dTDP-glucose 4,6-dehydratase